MFHPPCSVLCFLLGRIQLFISSEVNVFAFSNIKYHAIVSLNVLCSCSLPLDSLPTTALTVSHKENDTVNQSEWTFLYIWNSYQLYKNMEIGSRITRLHTAKCFPLSRLAKLCMLFMQGTSGENIFWPPNDVVTRLTNTSSYFHEHISERL